MVVAVVVRLHNPPRNDVGFVCETGRFPHIHQTKRWLFSVLLPATVSTALLLGHQHRHHSNNNIITIPSRELENNKSKSYTQRERVGDKRNTSKIPFFW